MLTTKKIIRNILLPGAFKLGVDKLLRSFSDKSILNVMYHGVVEQDLNYFTPRHIAAKQFEEHLKYYKKNFDIISIAEAFEMYRKNIRPKRKTITISFDDGYFNNLETAVPLLEKYNSKATFFILGICTQEMNIRALWADVLACLRYSDKDARIEIDGKEFVGYYNEQTNSRMRDYLKKMPYEKRDIVVEGLIKQFDLNDKMKRIPEEAWRLLTKSELLKLSQSKIAEIGSHAYLHYNLGNIDASNVKRELSLSKTLLEEVIQKPVDQIAYPDGSYSNEAKDLAEKIGYRNQFAVDYLFTEDENDHRILNRQGISSTTTHESNMYIVNRAFSTKGYG